MLLLQFLLFAWVSCFQEIQASQEYWGINPRSSVFSENFTSEKLGEILDKCNIQHGSIEPEQTPENVLIAENKALKVFLKGTSFVPHHIIIEPKEKLSTPKEFLAFLLEAEKSTRLIHDIYVKKFGYHGYTSMIFFPHLENEGIRIEVLSGRFYQGKENTIDMVEKVQRVLYQFFPDFKPSGCFKAFSEKDVDVFKDGLLGLEKFEIKPGKKTDFKPWHILWDRSLEAKEIIFSHFKNYLETAGAIVISKKESKSTPSIGPSTEESKEKNTEGEVSAIHGETERKIEKCAFCDPKINGGAIYQGQYVRLLYNYQPYSPVRDKKGMHLLITPKAEEHYENFSDLSPEAVKETFEVMLAAARIFQTKYPEQRVFGFIQNGQAAGQTVPHTHWHILTAPSIGIDVLLLEHFLGIKHHPLSLSEGKEICEEYGNTIKLQLSSLFQ